jgi:hypothetical protein
MPFSLSNIGLFRAFYRYSKKGKLIAYLFIFFFSLFRLCILLIFKHFIVIIIIKKKTKANEKQTNLSKENEEYAF